MFNSDGRVLTPDKWISEIVENKGESRYEKRQEELNKRFNEKFSDENIQKEQKDKLAIEKLILDGYFLIREANDKFIPYQLKFVGDCIINRIRYLPSWLIHTILSLLLAFTLLIIGCLGARILNYDQVSLSESLETSFKSWYFWLMAGLMAGGLELTRYMIMQVVDAIDELVSLLKPDPFDSLRKNPGESSAISMLRRLLEHFLNPRPLLPLLIAFTFIALALFRHYMAGGLLAPLSNMFAFYPLMILS